MKALRPINIPFPSTGSFVRASTATYIEDGLVKTAAINEPRWQDGLLLYEPAATNLYIYSESFSLPVWIKTQSSVSANAALSPDGLTTSADKLVENTANARHYLSREITTNNVLKYYTFSIFVKAAGRSKFRIDSLDIAVGSGNYADFDLSAKTTVAYGNCKSSIKILDDGWFRISCTFSVLVSGSTAFNFELLNDLNESTYTGDGTSGVFIWGAQAEQGETLSSYISTDATSLTRPADSFTGTGLIYTNATDARVLWSSATTYAVGVVVRYNNKVYESLQATNLNKQPDINPTWWLDLGADNISAAFDGKVGSKTTATDVLRMIIAPGSAIDSVAYIETSASIVTTSVYDNLNNFIYSQSSGLDSSVIEDWYDYFFLDPLGDPITQVVHQGISSIDPNLVIGVEIIRSGEVSLGSFLTGQTTKIGLTQYGVRAGIVDYSRKDVDEFGNISVVERAYSKRLEADVYVYNYDLNKVQRFLYNVRATPLLWIATDDPELAEVSNVYGFYKDFSTTIAYPDVSLCSLQVEGLT